MNNYVESRLGTRLAGFLLYIVRRRQSAHLPTSMENERMQTSTHVSEVTGKDADRTGFVGGSDAPIIVGASTYKTVQQLYYEKRGELPPEDISDKPYVLAGQIFEDGIAEWYQHRTGEKLRRVNVHQQHPKYPWMRAQIDRKVEGKRKLCEIKNHGVFAFANNDEWGQEGTDQVPFSHLVQVTHQLAVTGYDEADLAVCIGGQRLALYHIERDDELVEMLVGAEVEFWQCVESGNVPQLDYSHPAALDFLKRKYPGTNGQVCDLPEHCVDLAQQYQELGRIASEAKKERDRIKAELLELCGDAAVGMLPGGAGGFTRRVVDAKEISYTRPAYVDFRFSKNPKVN